MKTLKFIFGSILSFGMLLPGIVYSKAAMGMENSIVDRGLPQKWNKLSNDWSLLIQDKDKLTHEVSKHSTFNPNFSKEDSDYFMVSAIQLPEIMKMSIEGDHYKLQSRLDPKFSMTMKDLGDNRIEINGKVFTYDIYASLQTNMDHLKKMFTQKQTASFWNLLLPQAFADTDDKGYYPPSAGYSASPTPTPTPGYSTDQNNCPPGQDNFGCVVKRNAWQILLGAALLAIGIWGWVKYAHAKNDNNNLVKQNNWLRKQLNDSGGGGCNHGGGCVTQGYFGPTGSELVPVPGNTAPATVGPNIVTPVQGTLPSITAPMAPAPATAPGTIGPGAPISVINRAI